MAKGIAQRTPTDKLIHKMRLMADAGGMLTRDRIRTIIESADRMEELDERVAIMSETEDYAMTYDTDTRYSNNGGE